MAWKTTFFFDLNKPGWSESHFNITAADEATARLDAIELAKTRLGICGWNVIMSRIRISLYGNKRRYPPVDLTPLVGGDGTARGEDWNGGNAAFDDSADYVDTSLMVDTDGVGNGIGRIYLAGIPDMIINSLGSGYDPAGRPWWLNKFQAFQAALIAGGKWGFRVRSVAAPAFQQTGVVAIRRNAAPPSLLGFDVVGDPAWVTQGVQLQLRGLKKLDLGKRTLNGIYTVESKVASPVVGQTTVYLWGTALFDESLYQPPGTLETVVYELDPYKAIIPNRAGDRDRGIGFAPPRGRRRRRLSV